MKVETKHKMSENENEMELQKHTSCSRAAATICPARACNGSVQRQPWARPAEHGTISQCAPSSRPAARAARRLDVHEKMSDVRQHHRLMVHGCGHNNVNIIERRNSKWSKVLKWFWLGRQDSNAAVRALSKWILLMVTSNRTFIDVSTEDISIHGCWCHTCWKKPQTETEMKLKLRKMILKLKLNWNYPET